MGFSELVAQIVLVFLFIVIFLTLFTSYKNYVESTSSHTDYLFNQMNLRLQTDFKIVDSDYQAGFVTITLINKGSVRLNTDFVDLYVNGNKLLREDISFNIFNKTFNDVFWNPTEAMNISFFMIMEDRNLIQVSSQHGVSAYHQIVI
jgi:archaellum component FlaF (FlaF/FlaG flagellin family)